MIHDQIDRFIDDLLILTDFDNDAVQINDGIDGIKGAGLPLCHTIHNGIRDLGDQALRDISIVQFFEGINDIPRAHPFGVEVENFVVYGGKASLSFFYQLRLKRAISISWDINI